MTPSSPEQTLDLATGTLFDLARAKYEAAWREALLTGGAPPDRAHFLEDAGPDRERLASILDYTDGAYLKLRDLIRTGAASLSPVGPTPQETPVDRVPTQTSSRFAETFDSFTPKDEVEPGSPGSASQFAETVDSPNAGQRGERSSPSVPLDEGATVGGYELLGVIAHGGMGVVYKARHIRLDRLAAIKMVLAGAHASPEQFARFRSEAQVVASLQHPNIVQLYDVGEHDNLPYLALEFVEGGSLAHKAGGRPQPPGEAAAMVEVMARAMDYAHGKGVVHRDLKPANVILTASGAPKVTDFGLAKRLEQDKDTGQTRTGTLMGTPSYMAPEQAAGKGHAVGPHTDVYALGAILYELLTGVPPFSGSTPLKTILAVLNTDAVAPRRLQPNIPQDLETVCLKCLEKEPQQRYGSAAELADDLRRFMAGETIRARPIGRAERLWRWCRRNPGVSALTAAVMVLLTTVAGVSTAAALRVGAEKRIAESNAESARAAQSLAEQAKLVSETALKDTKEAKAATEAALKLAENARTEAEKASRRADSLATVAAAQRELALDALGGLVTKVQTHLDDAPGVQQLRKELLELALGGLKKIAGDETEVVDMRMAEGHRRLGELAQRLGDLDLARKNYQQVDRIVRQQSAANPDDPNWKRAVSVAATKLGDLCAATGDRVGARRHYEDARKLREDLLPIGGIPAKVDLAQVYEKLGNVSGPKTSVDLYKDSLRLREEIVKERPRDGNAAVDVRVSHHKLAEVYLVTGEVATARIHSLRAVGIAEALVKANQKSQKLKQDLALARAKLGDVCRAEKRPIEARKQYEEAVRVLEPLATGNPRDLTLQVMYALFLAHSGRYVKAAELAGRVHEQAPKNPFLLYNAACAHAVVADVALETPEDQRTPEHAKLIKGYQEAALSGLKAALDAGFADHNVIRTDPELAALRNHPGFAEIAKGLRPVTGDR